MTTTWFSRNQPSSSSTSVSDRLGGPGSPHPHSRPAGGRPSADSARAGSNRTRCPRPRRPIRSRPAPGAGSPSCLRRRRWPPTRERIRRVSRSSFAGPRFWHGGVMLWQTEFWLCSNRSLSGNTSKAYGRSGATGSVDTVCSRCTNPPVSPQFFREAWDRQD